jgi:hypothetical protein
MHLNQKDLRIRKLWERGMRNKADIARKIGYGGLLNEGIQRVNEGLERLGLVEQQKIQYAPLEVSSAPLDDFLAASSATEKMKVETVVASGDEVRRSDC